MKTCICADIMYAAIETVSRPGIGPRTCQAAIAVERL